MGNGNYNTALSHVAVTHTSEGPSQENVIEMSDIPIKMQSWNPLA